MSYLMACVAGEPSGDLLAVQLLQGIALHPQLADSQFFGIGGPRMQEQGFTSSWPMDTLSVRGYVEVLSKLSQILKVRRELTRRIEA